SAKPLRRLVVVLGDAAAAIVGEPKDGLCASVTSFGERSRQPQRGIVVSLLVGGVGGVGRLNWAGDANSPGQSDDGLLDRLMIDAEREAQRQHDDGDRKRDQPPEFRPTP